MSISKKAIAAIRRSSNLRAKLMLVDGKSEYTIKRWIEDGNDKLTMPKYTAVIAAHTKMKLEDIIQNETENV